MEDKSFLYTVRGVVSFDRSARVWKHARHAQKESVPIPTPYARIRGKGCSYYVCQGVPEVVDLRAYEGRTWIQEFYRTGVRVEYEIIRLSDEKLSCCGCSHYTLISLKTQRPEAIPTWVLEKYTV